MAVFSLTPVYSVPSPSPVPQSELSEDLRLRTASRALRTGRVSASALSQRSQLDSPVPPSIPSKYRTVFYQMSENKGFQMQSPRFHSKEYFSDAPSPGAYNVAQDSLIRDDISLSTRGTCHFASKTKRFSKEKSQPLGPASYFPTLLIQTKKDFNRSLVSRLFQDPVVQQVKLESNTPSPNKYDLRTTECQQAQGDYSIFKSKTGRVLNSTSSNLLSNPGPGQYDVDNVKTQNQQSGFSSVFKSKSRRSGTDIRDLTPGPAEYSPHISPGRKNKPKLPRKLTLTLSAPAHPVPPTLKSPGPGSYEVQGDKTRPLTASKLKPSACFKSIPRQVQPQEDCIPGPATYKPRALSTRHSFIQNPSQKWI